MTKHVIRLFPVAVLLALPCTAFSATSSVDATTLFRVEQREITGAGRQTVLPATQFVQFDADSAGDGNLSLHFYGWGRADLGDKSYNDNTVDGSVTYGYLRYRFKPVDADVRIGRLFVREGVVNEHLDGISARSRLPMGFGLSAFAGAPVHTSRIAGETSDGKGDTIFGGRISYRYGTVLELGLSGVDEGRAPTLVDHPNGNHRLVGGDIWLSPHRMVELIGHTSYNQETGGVAEHAYLLNVKPLQGLVLSGEFNEYRGRNFFNASPLFSSMPTFDPAEDARTTGVRASYPIWAGIVVDADYRRYSRDRGSADRYGAELKSSFLNRTLRSGIGYHYLRAGEGFSVGSGSSGSYHQLRGYAMHDTPTHFAAVDLIGYLFDEKINNESRAWEATVSAGYRLSPALSLSGDVGYGSNPEYSDNLRALLRLTYNITFDGKGARK